MLCAFKQYPLLKEQPAMQRDPIAAAAFTAQYREACRQTDQLFALIKPAFLTERPVRERHRLLFYIGHLEAFDWNLLSDRLFKLQSFAPDYDKLFAFGIDPVGGGLPTDTPEDWPSMTQIYAYRDGVRARIESGITGVDFAQPARGDHPGGIESGDPGVRVRDFAVDGSGDADPATLLQVAIEHRQMHVETLAYLIHQMPLSQKCVPEDLESLSEDLCDTEPLGDIVSSVESHGLSSATSLEPAMAQIDAGEVVLGLSRARSSGPASAEEGGDSALTNNAEDRLERRANVDPGSQFGWDNEYIDADKQRVSVERFWMDRHMVSNGDFLAFMDAGGYQNAKYWQPEDWAWRCSSGLEHPAFWQRDGDAWMLQTMFERRSLPRDWPVYVSHAEAQAYAQFVGKRLPSEAEWMRAALGAAQADQPPIEGNFDFRHWDPVSIRAYPRNCSQFGVHGQFGNGWEWTGDRFAPFPGFRAFSFYPGYSADFFDDRHFVMKGGSPRTAARMLRPTFRNWFQPHYPYVYAGFRCASDGPTGSSRSSGPA